MTLKSKQKCLKNQKQKNITTKLESDDKIKFIVY